MGHSSAAFQNPNPMKKKVIAAIVAVVIAHVGVLWSLSYLKVAELKKIEKKPVQVKFVKITEDIPPPPPPATPVKPKVKPVEKPVEKKVEPVVKPKVIAQKTPVIEKKVIHQDDTQEKLKQEQQRLLDEQKRQEQLKQEQALREQQAREQAAREQAARDQAARDAAAQRAKPRTLSAGEISWKRKPQLNFSNKDLGGSNKSVSVNIEADASGKITDVKILKSTGMPALDEKVLRAVRNAKFKASNDGSAMRAILPLELAINPNG
ncbi:energy transducer TonB family protein [Acinetobacter stercoris]|uniref:Transport protein TonB n=1 Tax=Acinetobacter stercoris TaxID=2126983 RepID=A0A2U3MVZ3_9GAMM|nr:energy transducer TonB [Acinetobacter stercoris]SPL69554.1 transport protein TonB [Acinetobacter stercoris]